MMVDVRVLPRMAHAYPAHGSRKQPNDPSKLWIIPRVLPKVNHGFVRLPPAHNRHEERRLVTSGHEEKRPEEQERFLQGMAVMEQWNGKLYRH